MKNECAKAILKLIPSHTVWCDRDTLQNVLQQERYDPFEIGKAIRYLVRKRLLVQLVVNLPPRSAINKIYSSELDSSDPALYKSHENAFENVMSVPTQMIGPTKRWAGICGCNHRIPKRRADWVVHLRLNVAFSSSQFSKDNPNHKSTPTTQRDERVSAIDGENVFCIPIDLLHKHFQMLGSSSSGKGSGYENR